MEVWGNSIRKNLSRIQPNASFHEAQATYYNCSPMNVNDSANRFRIKLGNMNNELQRYFSVTMR